METIFKNYAGVQMETFLRQYGERIKNKHVLYAVTTNLEEDRQISRSTRARLGGVNIKIGKSTGNPYARLKSYTYMSSNYQAQFPQSGVRVLFVREYPRRTEGQSGKPIVDIVETLVKRALRAENRLVPKRGSEIFNVDPQELFGLIESIETSEYQYDERRSSERLGKRLLWMITDTLTGSMKLMYAEDYDEVMRKFAESTDPSLMDDRSKYLTRYFIRPVNRPYMMGAPRNVETPSVTTPTVEMPQGSEDSTPIRVTRGSRRPREDDDISSQPPPQRPRATRETVDRVRAGSELEQPPPQRRGQTIPTSGRVRGGAGLLDRFDDVEERAPQRRRFTATELREAEYQPSDVPPILGVDNLLGKRPRSLKDIYADPRSDKKIRNNPPQGRKRQTYRENIERPRVVDRDARDAPGQGPYNPLDWGFEDWT